jgi:hypothetical protein
VNSINELVPSCTPSTKLGLTISENVSWQLFSLNQKSPGMSATYGVTAGIFHVPRPGFVHIQEIRLWSVIYLLIERRAQVPDFLAVDFSEVRVQPNRSRRLVGELPLKFSFCDSNALGARDDRIAIVKASRKQAARQFSRRQGSPSIRSRSAMVHSKTIGG